MKYLFLKRNSAKKVHDDMLVIPGDKRPFYSTVKNWVARFRTGHLSTEYEECSRRPTQVTVPKNVDAIHSTFLDDGRISAKSRDPGDVPRNDRLYYSRDFRQERALSLTGSQMPQCCSEA
jgi:hypothetical protein